MATMDSQQPQGSSLGSGAQHPARDAVNEMLDAGVLDGLMDKVDQDGLALTGQGGFLPELVKAVLERGLQTEMTDHLGYDKGDPAGRGSPNSRNGTSGKTVSTEVGDVELEVPRDRAGSFDPRLVPKGSRRAGGLDEIIISLVSTRFSQGECLVLWGTSSVPGTVGWKQRARPVIGTEGH